MPITSLSPSSQRPVDQNQAVNDPRILANDGEANRYLRTIAKVASVFVGVLASVASFAAGGPLVGAVVSLISGIGILLLFNSCEDDSHRHTPPRTTAVVQPTPWYQQFFPVVLTTPAPHVHVTPWYHRVLSFPTGNRSMNNPPPVAHVRSGGGHFTTPPTPAPSYPQPPAPSGPGGHVQRGGGHLTPPAPSQGRLPPPSGPGVPHVHSGGGHFPPAPPPLPAQQTPPPSGPGVPHIRRGGGHF